MEALLALADGKIFRGVGFGAEGEVAEVVQASQTQFATNVAKEVAKDLIPPPVRTALLVLALVGVGALIYLLVLAR